MSQQPALPGTVKDTGAHEGEILVGIGIHNQGLLVKVYQDQPAGSGGRVEGQVLLLHQGTGEYAEGIKMIARKTFDSADACIQRLQQEPDGTGCSDILNADSLWQLDVNLINSCILKR
jgi:hypothetical protein